MAIDSNAYFLNRLHLSSDHHSNPAGQVVQRYDRDAKNYQTSQPSGDRVLTAMDNLVTSTMANWQNLRSF